MTPAYGTPGVYPEEFLPVPEAGLATGVPAFLGFVAGEPLDAQENPVRPQMLTLWAEFEQRFGKPLPDGYLGPAVRGFFDNGGRVCYVVTLSTAPTADALGAGLEIVASLDAIDLVCAPDIARLARLARLRGDPDPTAILQQRVLEHCDAAGDRFALLDSGADLGVDAVQAQRAELTGINGALYYPWVRIPDGPFAPPCGHVAGVYASTDRRVGTHKAPANDALQGVVDLQVNLSNAQQGLLNPEGINCLRAFPGRGIRVWGARTLSRDPAWRYVNVRRLFLTAGRWIARNLADSVLEPNDQRLWARIGRALSSYFSDLVRIGALKGATAQEAFYVKCDAETNPPEVRDLGQVVTEIGLAPALPGEFIVVRIVHAAGGVTITGPGLPG